MTIIDPSGPRPEPFDDLDAVAAAGFGTDEWSRWQQGGCGTYAAALIDLHPHLRLGGIDFDRDPGSPYFNPHHFFAHDDRWAWDSAGRHPLPYHGIGYAGSCGLDLGDPADYGLPQEENEPTDAAVDHIARHDIGPARTVTP